MVTWDQIPPVLSDATTAVEDSTFWDNAGFDPVGILASGVDALRGRPRGGSTITQQLVRQRLLSTDGSAQTEPTFTRKIKEIIQSIRVTQAFPGVDGKRRIMAAYLNQNYYGNDTYGVAAAIKDYFGIDLTDPKSAAKLTLAQAAIIAALPQAPDYYDLVQNAQQVCTDPGPDATDQQCKAYQLQVPTDSPIVLRRNQVLDLMASGRTPLTGDKYSAADYAAAKQEPVVLVPQTAPQWLAPQFVWQVRRELATQLCGQGVDTCPVLERGGLTIVTTLDYRLQQIAEKWVKAAAIVPHAKNPAAAAKALGVPYRTWMANLTNKTLYNGALIAQDYQTGELIAYVGSADANAAKATKRFQPRFDVLADGWRQPGSAFKPIMYATGIAGRFITAASVFMDVATNFGGGYVPTDADLLERGPVRVQDALRFSLNIPAVKALSIIGVPRVQAQAEAMGLTFQNGPTNAGLSFALGVAEVHAKDLVRAYGTLADGGQLADQTTLMTVTDSTGKELIGLDTRQPAAKVLDPGAAYIITDTLAGNTDPSINPFWGQFELTGANGAAPAGRAQDRHQQRRQGPQRLGLHRRPVVGRPQEGRVRPGRRHLERQLGQLAREQPIEPAVLDRRHHLRLAGLPPGGHQELEHQRVPQARRPRPGNGGRVDRDARQRQGPAGQPAVPVRHGSGQHPAARHLRRRGPDERRVREQQPDLARGRPRLDEAGPEGRVRRRRREGFADLLLLQRRVQPVRPLVGSADGRRRLRFAVPQPIVRPLRVGAGVGVARAVRRLRLARGAVPVAVRVAGGLDAAIQLAGAVGSAHCPADAGPHAAANSAADASADRAAHASSQHAANAGSRHAERGAERRAARHVPPRLTS